MVLKSSESKNNYIYTALALAALLAVIAWTFFKGYNDGKEHRKESANQNTNQNAK